MTKTKKELLVSLKNGKRKRVKIYPKEKQSKYSNIIFLATLIL